MNKNLKIASNKKEKISDIEEALLGLLLVYKKVDSKTSQVFTFLDSTNFSSKQTKTLFEILKDFYDKKHNNFDIKLIKKYVDDNNLNNIITVDFMNNIISNAGLLNSLNEYLNIIIENSKKNKLLNSLNQTINTIDNKFSDEIIDQIRNELYEIEERKINKDFVHSKDVVSEVINDIFSSNNEIKGIKTGFYKLDQITNGLQNGDLIILAARPSVGKTAFALNLALNAMKIEKKYVAFFSLEMPAKQLIQRLLSSVSNVFNNKFKNNEHDKLSDFDKEKLFEAGEKIKKMNLFIDDSASIKLDEIIWKSRKQKEQGKLDLIIIDYLQLIPTNSSSDNRQQEVSKISRSLKQLARELNVPIVALSQLNRRVELREEKKPMMSDLRESGAIEQDADIIAFLYREEYYSKDKDKKSNVQITELNIAKHRNGSIGTIELCFNPSLGLFRDFNESIDKKEE